jgi:hypothetical protein
MIDIHTHLGRIYYGREPLKRSDLIHWMDVHGIDKACVMAIENPEECHWYMTSDRVLELCADSDRLIPFCNVDPRIGYGSWVKFYEIIKDYTDRGAKGFGEVKVSLPLDDIRMAKIYDACGKLGIPVLIHMDRVCGYDDFGLPRLRRMLEAFPATNFILHASHFWAEISGDVTEAQAQNNKAVVGYPITPGGAVFDVLWDYPNAYGDMSALSCYNNLMRANDDGLSFCSVYSGKLLLGSDYLEPGQEVPMLEHLRKLGLAPEDYQAITHDNAERLLGLK